jgi:hypothetical protein
MDKGNILQPKIATPVGIFGLGLAGVSWAMNYYEWPVPDFVAKAVAAGSVVLLLFGAAGMLSAAWEWRIVAGPRRWFSQWRIRSPIARRGDHSHSEDHPEPSTMLPATFYSRNDRERISEELFNLSEALRAARRASRQAFEMFDRDWRTHLEASQQGAKSSPMSGVTRRAGKMADEAKALHAAVDGRGGFLRSHYASVMQNVLQLDRIPNPLGEYMGAASSLEVAVRPLECVSDQKVEVMLMQNTLAIPLDNAHKAYRDFDQWLDHCLGRIDTARRELRSA